MMRSKLVLLYSDIQIIQLSTLGHKYSLFQGVEGLQAFDMQQLHIECGLGLVFEVNLCLVFEGGSENCFY